MTDEDRIRFLRNQLVLWVQGKLPLTWVDVQDYTLELDRLLQQFQL